MEILPYCIIGAGPSGLAASRALSALDIPHVVYEKHRDIGGIWDLDNKGSPLYESAHFISSKWTSGFSGFPMGAVLGEPLADYPQHEHVLSYLKAFCAAYSLRKNIALNSEVRSVHNEEPDVWQVQLTNGKTARHRGVICANGVTWIPAMPQWPGQFEGEIRHSVTYRSSDEFRGKRVLIVGLGNSGADIACDAARHAKFAAVSVRRGYHFMPKHIFGWPIDVFFRRADLLPPELQGVDVRTGIRAVTGDPKRWGMPEPDHEFGQAHPLLNTQLFHHLAHGDIQVRPDIERFEGSNVVFRDRSMLEVDFVLAATGYQVKAPYVDDSLFELKGQRTQQYLNVFSKTHHELYTLGFAEVAAGIYPLIDQMAHLLAHHLNDRLRHPDKARAFEELKTTDDFNPKGKNRYVASDRHSNYVDMKHYVEKAVQLCQQFDWPTLSESTHSN
jgi:cation diffusion facilitator CzcD-associated flavoprotein CzcO